MISAVDDPGLLIAKVNETWNQLIYRVVALTIGAAAHFKGNIGGQYGCSNSYFQTTPPPTSKTETLLHQLLRAMNAC